MRKRLLAIGDSHGCFRQLYLLLTEVINLNRQDEIVLLGDYIDRGDDSKAILDLIMDLIANGYNIIPLKGNHEDMMLKASESVLNKHNWMLNGGEQTLTSFGVTSVSEIDSKYLDFISGLKLYHQYDKYLFVHAGFNDDLENPFEDEYSMIWERRFDYRSPFLRDKIIVHGHRPQPLADLRQQLKDAPQVINIDTGCVYGKESGLGNLSAIDLFTMKIYSVSCQPDV